jgi:hypothetical protein
MRLTAREPTELTRSPTSIGFGSWCSGVARMPLETIGMSGTSRRRCGRPPTAATTARMCSGVVPQQPPTSETPRSTTNSRSAAASGAGSSG